MKKVKIIGKGLASDGITLVASGPRQALDEQFARKKRLRHPPKKKKKNRGDGKTGEAFLSPREEEKGYSSEKKQRGESNLLLCTRGGVRRFELERDFD